ncbi:integrin alpha [uncultured Sphingomonas sp.]|uniref:integrin alpha n=1 Tax=uncultured Sphingomonas sp. TaxID=158754 RepID=UPI0035C9A4FD
MDLDELPSDVGVKIVGETANDLASFWVASAGDVNGNGRADLIVGSPQNDPAGSDAGAAYVISGRGSD